MRLQLAALLFVIAIPASFAAYYFPKLTLRPKVHSSLSTLPAE